MKKALIPAALILAISFTPFLPTPACLADPGASATSILASSLFWHLIDIFRTSELARVIAATPDGQTGKLPATAVIRPPSSVKCVIEHSITLDHKYVAL